MAQLAIKGHPTRGSEVIALLEMLGGREVGYLGLGFQFYYYIDECGNIIGTTELSNSKTFIIYTLEEFLEKFPYKVGDKVIYKSEVFPIIGMKWDCCRDIVIYTIKTNCGIIDCYDNTWMKPYKEENMEGKIESFEILESHCFDEVKIEFDPAKFEMVKRDNGYYVVKKQPQYPKTYGECGKILHIKDKKYLISALS